MRYKFVNRKNPKSWSIQDQAGYDALAKKGWLKRFEITVINDAPEVGITKKTFLPPELQQIRGGKPTAPEPVVLAPENTGPQVEPSTEDNSNG